MLGEALPAGQGGRSGERVKPERRAPVFPRLLQQGGRFGVRRSPPLWIFLLLLLLWGCSPHGVAPKKKKKNDPKRRRPPHSKVPSMLFEPLRSLPSWRAIRVGVSSW